MAWDLTRNQGEVVTDQIINRNARPVRSQVISGLLPGLHRPEFPVGESPESNRTFLHQFRAAGGNYPISDFRALGWVHFQDHGWWHRLVGYVIDNLGDVLRQARLSVAVRAVQYGVPQSAHHFFAMLEMYNPTTITFFTPSGELGFALHEMFNVSGLSMGEIPYKKYVPGTEELQILRRDGLKVYETYWELLCHFHICLQLTGSRYGGVKQMSWANYLFPGLEDKKKRRIGRLEVVLDDNILERVS